MFIHRSIRTSVFTMYNYYYIIMTGQVIRYQEYEIGNLQRSFHQEHVQFP